jgi:hypothetical protein
MVVGDTKGQWTKRFHNVMKNDHCNAFELRMVKLEHQDALRQLDASRHEVRALAAQALHLQIRNNMLEQRIAATRLASLVSGNQGQDTLLWHVMSFLDPCVHTRIVSRSWHRSWHRCVTQVSR